MKQSFYLITGKGNNTNNFPFAYSTNLNRAKLYAESLSRDSVRVQRCTDITLFVLLDRHFIINLDA